MKKTLLLWGFVSCFLFNVALLADVPQLMKNAHYGAMVVNLDNDDVQIAHNVHQSFAPASLTKLITTASAIEMLTPDYVYQTRLSYIGQVQADSLLGDLVVKGSGDPTLGSEYFKQEPMGFLHAWINHLKKNGISHVSGDLIVDVSVFDSKVIGDKWIWEDVGNYYGAGVYGLSFRDNRYYLTLKSAAVGAPVQLVDIQPEGLDIDFECMVVGADNHRDNAYIYGSPWTFERRIRGTIPAYRDSFVIKGAMPNPPLVFGLVFQALLEASGIHIQGEVKVNWQGETRASTLLSTWVSPSLSEIACVTNKASNNLYAEHLLKTLAIGAELSQSNVAIDKLMTYWQGQGLDCRGVKLYDGSGLSRANLLTPQFVVDILCYMDKSTYRNSFMQSLAVAGVDGTFRYFLDHTPLAQNVKGKSGGMRGVRCYAGYVEWQNQHYAFCVMVNNSTASMAEMKVAIENYLLSIFN